MSIALSLATKSFLSYFGGKSQLVSTIIPLLPKHRAYVEVFGGDTADTVFYIDPPYDGYEKVYGKDQFDKSDFDRLAALLGGVEGKFIMSINDTPGIRATFSDFVIRKVATRYSMGKVRKAGKSTELLIANFPLSA